MSCGRFAYSWPRVENDVEHGGQPERWIGRTQKSDNLGRRRLNRVVRT
jgi:hypothetical protein